MPRNVKSTPKDKTEGCDSSFQGIETLRKSKKILNFFEFSSKIFDFCNSDRDRDRDCNRDQIARDHDVTETKKRDHAGL